jgi:NAD(P)-dependent dehydrogenase (short-subunit alcohol dehydrogenase family)
MSKVSITGSSDGLGKMTAELLLSQGHEVVPGRRGRMALRYSNRG